MAIKNTIFKVDNGAGEYDEQHFKTNSGQVDIGGGNLKEYLNKVNIATSNDGTAVEQGQEGWAPLGNGEKLFFGWFNLQTNAGETHGSRIYTIPGCTKIRNAIVCGSGNHTVSLLNLGGSNNKMNVALFNAKIDSAACVRYLAFGV